MIDPNWSSPPGDTIVRLMDTKEIDGAELADALGISTDDFDALIRGHRRLTESDAGVLADNLGSTTRFWLARDKSYVLDMARLDESSQDSEASWVASMPAASMRKFGWVPKGSKSKNKLKDEILAFFGCLTLQEWGQRYSSGVGAVAFRTSLSLASDGMATLVWLRAGELAIADRDLPEFDLSAFRNMLPGLKKLSAFKRPSAFVPRLVAACRSVGVAVATARTPDGCRASGASWFDTNGNPVILLSFRHMAEDHFWFTFFHEAAHIVLHGQDHIDGEGAVFMGTDTETQEREANEFAQELLFPANFREELDNRGVGPKAIMAIARAVDVTPGIIVGQLQRADVVDHSKLNFLKRRYRWGEDPNIPDLID
ncbi:ImmA/IrrE family metallo-endopeptidase [Mesorhizobium sp. M7A.F.Ca.CA.001.07.2.1]|nr:ImmA/IrrE family metallo-endopeptidase [Mesorhizobium sp. M7A.F.Ca.MR.362.00.0.0]RUX72492.1 ImmA/IrrE family metallo-endopeptidase [Mesorhizobium sp. M7A.F.Ca.CA.004.08.2.1]RUX83730.1 ImmA/IrrE family metallo-endopeptidase [Mesorhizobium sp. M7A.F.Ca.CA.004.08.1.1]RUY01629.1 ImmA/IrrE family metallo-endopeptidase [Mesorhizobium sp. M7A.F.Ca.CA.004.04.1.1]RUY20703.1 ImmA/IrrE family metallo-endopeptidase [Mesorhizobium sp. M7A.F.Ca.CA.004.12.1.1]RUY58215.1 ImmA/IrrE family metallo-endopeptid